MAHIYAKRFSDELMTAFGRFIVQWATFETQMAFLFSEFIDGPAQRAHMIFYTTAGFGGKRDLLYAVIADSFFTEPSQELVAILNEAEPLGSLRNDLVHGHWQSKTKKEAAVWVSKPRSKQRSYSVNFEVDDLEQWTAAVAELTSKLEDLDVKSLTRRRKHRPKNPRN